MTLYHHQVRAAAKAKNGNLCLFHDCGTGKTRTAIEIIRHYRQGKKGFKVLVVCPLILIKNAWLRELAWCPELTAVSLWEPNAKKRDKLYEKKADVYLINFEQLWRNFQKIDEMKFDMIIVDESSKMKDSRSNITKALLALAGIKSKKFAAQHTIPHRYCLSGTPAPNNQLEYYSQIAFVKEEIFGRSFFAFRSMWCQPNFHFGKFTTWDFRPELQQQFNDRMAPVVDVVRKEDALDLPPRIDCPYTFQLGSQAADHYQCLKKQLYTEIQGHTILAEHQLTKLQKLRQVACGFIYDSSKDAWRCDSVRLDFLCELLEKLEGQQVVIWTSFVETMGQISQQLGKSSSMVYGSQAAKQKAIDEWMSGKTQYVIQNPQSGAHGLNYQHNACVCVYYNPDWSWELRSQSQDRIHRIGQTKPVTAYHILAENTIDELIYKATEDKRALCDAVMEHLKK